MIGHKRILFLIVLGGWTSWVGAANEVNLTPQFNPQAVKILKDTLEKYQSCKTYQDEGTLMIAMKDKDDENTKRFETKLAFVRPNKMNFVWPSLTLVCDGKRCQSVYPDFKQYLDRAAPPVITEAFMKDALLEENVTFVLQGLLGKTPYETLAGTLQRLDYLGVVEAAGRKFYKISYVQGDDHVEVLINADTMLLDQIVLSPQKAKNRKWELRMVYKKVVLNAPIPDTRFAILPPTGVRKVDRISFTRQYDYPKLNQMLPEGSLDLFGANRKGSIKTLLGAKLTFVTFWATWCPPCRGELPELEKLYLEYQSKGFQVIGVNLDQDGSNDAIQSVVTDMKLTFPILLDPESKLATAMAVESIPTLLILDNTGRIVEAHVGTSPNSPREFKGIIERAVQTR